MHRRNPRRLSSHEYDLPKLPIGRILGLWGSNEPRRPLPSGPSPCHDSHPLDGPPAEPPYPGFVFVKMSQNRTRRVQGLTYASDINRDVQSWAGASRSSISHLRFWQDCLTRVQSPLCRFRDGVCLLGYTPSIRLHPLNMKIYKKSHNRILY